MTSRTLDVTRKAKKAYADAKNPSAPLHKRLTRLFYSNLLLRQAEERLLDSLNQAKKAFLEIDTLCIEAFEKNACPEYRTGLGKSYSQAQTAYANLDDEVAKVTAQLYANEVLREEIEKSIETPIVFPMSPLQKFYPEQTEGSDKVTWKIDAFAQPDA